MMPRSTRHLPCTNKGRTEAQCVTEYAPKCGYVRSQSSVKIVSSLPGARGSTGTSGAKTGKGHGQSPSRPRDDTGACIPKFQREGGDAANCTPYRPPRALDLEQVQGDPESPVEFGGFGHVQRTDEMPEVGFLHAQKIVTWMLRNKLPGPRIHTARVECGAIHRSFRRS